MSSFLPLLALAALVGPAPSGPGDLSYTASNNMVTTLDPSFPLYSAPPGIGYDGVAGLLITKPTGTFLCTGSLYGNEHRHVVTAAHCLLDATSVDAVFFPPAGGTIVRTTSSYMIKPGYTGSVIDENDIGVIDLHSSLGTGVQSYDLFSGNPLGRVYDEVGFGRSGTGATGSTLPSGLRRHGFNRFDFSGDDPIFDDPMFGPFWGNQKILFADFDNGTAAQDASCRLTAFFTAANSAYCDLGLGPAEALSAPGDSGGPLFVDGRLAAVASFGLTFGDHVVGDIDLLLNSTFGEFGGYVPVAPHAAWLKDALAPEPATFILMFTGLLGIAVMLRRRSENEA